MLDYETYLKKQGLCSNTTSFYMRNLRAIYNQAVKQGFTPQNHPFSTVYTGIAKTVKRAVNAKELQQIKSAKLPLIPSLPCRATSSSSVSTPVACR